MAKREIRQVPMGSLLASAKRLTKAELSKRTRAGGRGANTKSSWQESAWQMYDLVGEQRFLSTTLAGRMSKARLYVGKLNELDMTDSPEPVTDPRINNVLKAIGRTPSGRSQLIERLGVNLFMTGDGWLVGIPLHVMHRDEPDFELPEGYDTESVPVNNFDWRMLSTSEVAMGKDDMVTLKLDDGVDLTVDPDEVYMIRVWRPHPRLWWEADSSTRAGLPILKEMVSLTLHISAQIDSRLAGAGLLIVPQGAQTALQQAAGIAEDANEDQFTEALIEAMMTSIEERGSASAVVPLVVTVPDDVTEKFHHMKFDSPLDGEARVMRDDAIRRLALSQDAPPEVLLGTAGMNHWGGWLVQEDVVSTHLEPPLALICDALTTQYLWPVLEGMDIDDFENYVVWYSVDHLIVKPNLTTEAQALHAAGVISDEKLREVTGYSEEDAPDSGDPAKDMLLEMIRQNPGMLRSSGLADMIDKLKAIIDGRALPNTKTDLAPEVAEPPAPAPGTEKPAPEQAAPGASGAPQAPSPIPATAGQPAQLPASGGLPDPLQAAAEQWADHVADWDGTVEP